MVSFVVTAALLISAPQNPSAGQASSAADSAAIAVVVTDAASKKPLEGVEIRLDGAGSAARTDYMGEVSFRRARNSRFALNVRLVGYTAIDTSFDVGAIDWMHVVLALAPSAQPLAPATVVAPAPGAPHLAGFETRRQQGRGRYLTPEQLREAHDNRMIEVVSRIPGVLQDVGSNGSVKVVARTGPTSVVEAGSGGYGYVVRGEARARSSTKTFGGPDDGMKPGYCEVAVFMDGVYMKEPDLGNVRAAGFAAVEYYTPTNIPPEFKRPGTQCGVLLLWSR